MTRDDLLYKVERIAAISFLLYAFVLALTLGAACAIAIFSRL